MQIAADDDLIRVETCADPCGPNQSDKAASTAADDDLIRIVLNWRLSAIFMGTKDKIT